MSWERALGVQGPSSGGSFLPGDCARPVWLKGEDTGQGDPAPRLHPSGTTASLASSPHGISSLLSHLASGTAQQGDADGKASIEIQPLCAGIWSRDTEGSITGIQTLPCLCLAFPASLRPSPPSDVVAGKPKQTSLKPLPHDKDRPKLCLNTSDCGQAAPTLLKETKNRSKKPKVTS